MANISPLKEHLETEALICFSYLISYLSYTCPFNFRSLDIVTPNVLACCTLESSFPSTYTGSNDWLYFLDSPFLAFVRVELHIPLISPVLDAVDGILDVTSASLTHDFGYGGIVHILPPMYITNSQVIYH